MPIFGKIIGWVRGLFVLCFLDCIICQLSKIILLLFFWCGLGARVPFLLGFHRALSNR